MTGTFMVQSTVGGTKEWPYVESFEAEGEEFVVHATLTDPKTFRVSHKDTGFGVPDCASQNPQTALSLGIAFVELNKDKLKAALAKVRQ